METPRISSEYSFFNNRAQICVYQKYKFIKSIQCIPWRHISRIIFYDEEYSTCCICLSKPKFPRIDKCGHVFCLTCLINLFKHHQTDYVLCPLCKNYELQLCNTKRVKIVKSINPKVGDRLKLNLLAKGVENCIPRSGYKITYYVSNALPQSLDTNINYSYVSYDADAQVLNCITRDIEVLKRKKAIIVTNNSDDIYQETSKFLYKELDTFEGMYKFDGIYDVLKKNIGDRFNLLRLDKYIKSFDLFYQCSHKKYVFLDLHNTNEIMQTYLKLNRSPPISITGYVESLTTELVDKKFITRTHFKQLPIGATVMWVKLVNYKCEYEYLYGDWLKKLRNCKINDIREERKMELLNEEMALRKSDSSSSSRCSYLPDTLRDEILSSTEDGVIKSTDINDDHDNDKFQSYMNELQGFNTCTLGIECVAPDDAYPHDENCPYYQCWSKNSLDTEFADDENSRWMHLEESIESNSTSSKSTFYSPKLSSDFDDILCDNYEKNYNDNYYTGSTNLLPEPIYLDTELSQMSIVSTKTEDEGLKILQELKKHNKFVNDYLVTKKGGSQREMKNCRKKGKAIKN